MKTRDAPPTPPTRNSSGAASKGGRKPSPVEQALVDRFRAALASGEEGEALGDEALVADEFEPPARPAMRGGQDDGRTGQDVAVEPTNDMTDTPVLTVGALAGHSGHVAHAAAATEHGAQGAPSFHPGVFAQLLEKHVRQLLVSSPETGQPTQVMLSFSDEALPGTQITLAQTQDGWALKSQTSSDNAYRTMQSLAPQLKERFAQRGLGQLQLDIALKGRGDERSG
ncbi:MAG: hypothetical protein AAFU65_09555 [Pseudomonadota bacterium]